MKKFLISFLIQIILFYFFASPTQAALIINEVFPNPPSGSSEWIEVFNPDSEAVNLAGWKLEDQLSSPSTIFTFTEQSLNPDQYLVVQLSSAKLNNDQDGVTLKDQSGNQVDMMSYVSSENNQSWARWAREDGGSFVVATPSPGEPNFSNPTPVPSPTPFPTPNSTPSPQPSISPTPSPSPSPSPSPTPNNQITAADLQLSEIYPCPDAGEKEWLEIYNTANQAGTLTNWKIYDASDNTRTISVTINAHSLAVIEWTGSLLNNDGDSVTLTDANGNQSFTVNFDECVKGQSFISHDQAWRLTTTPTKNAVNIYTTDMSASPTLSPSPSSTSLILNSDLVDSDHDDNDSTAINSLTVEETTDGLAPGQDDLALPDLEIQTAEASESGDIFGQTTGPTPSAQLISPPPNKAGVVGLLGTSAAMVGGSCWAMVSAKRKGDSFT